MIIAFIILLILVALAIYLWYHPKQALVPYNYVIENVTPKIVYYTEDEKNVIFPASRLLENRWTSIRDEALSVMGDANDNLYSNFEHKDEAFWKGWTTYPLILHNTVIEDALQTCPQTMYMLGQTQNVSTAFFSILAPGKRLPPHYGPFKGVLRYHLGLIIPEGECYISVDHEPYYWKEGEGILFDETYEHYAVNYTKEPRVILFLDVDRPLREPLNTINKYIIQAIKWSPHNQQAIAHYNNRIPEVASISYATDCNGIQCLEK